MSMPDITAREIEEVVSVMQSRNLSIGSRTVEFERLIADVAEARHAVAVTNGTSALHLCMIASGVGPGDEVITSPFSFVASANCVLYVGATPVFVDCDPGSLNCDLAAVEAHITPRTKAIIGVEVFGNPMGMPELVALAARHEIPLVEDSCEGLGGRLGQRAIGSFGRVSVFGFYPNKQITTGEGGVIVTDDSRLAAKCSSMRNQGRPTNTMDARDGLGSWLVHERLGYNFRLSEINAALGVAQMSRLDEIIERRQEIADAYTRRLGGHPDLILPAIAPNVSMSWFVYVVRLSDRFVEEDRNEIIAGLRRHDVGSNTYFPPIPLLPFYREKCGTRPGDFPVAESVAQRTIALPFYNRITNREIDLVCQTLELMISRRTFARS